MLFDALLIFSVLFFTLPISILFTRVTGETKKYVLFQHKDLMVVIAGGIHLLPFRTEKLSPPALMVLGESLGE